MANIIRTDPAPEIQRFVDVQSIHIDCLFCNESATNEIVMAVSYGPNTRNRVRKIRVCEACLLAVKRSL